VNTAAHGRGRHAFIQGTKFTTSVVRSERLPAKPLKGPRHAKVLPGERKKRRVARNGVAGGQREKSSAVPVCARHARLLSLACRAQSFCLDGAGPHAVERIPANVWRVLACCLRSWNASGEGRKRDTVGNKRCWRVVEKEQRCHRCRGRVCPRDDSSALQQSARLTAAGSVTLGELVAACHTLLLSFGRARYSRSFSYSLPRLFFTTLFTSYSLVRFSLASLTIISASRLFLSSCHVSNDLALARVITERVDRASEWYMRSAVTPCHSRSYSRGVSFRGPADVGGGGLR